MLDWLLNLDIGFLLFLQDVVRNPILNKIMVFITTLGDEGYIWIAAAILLLIPKKTRKIGLMCGVALLAHLVLNNELLKNIVQRPRPFATFPELSIIVSQPGQFSFPSGHTSSSFAAAAVMYRYLPRRAGVPAMILAALIGFSRLYVGVHYPTDVLVGAAVGILCSYIAQWIVEKGAGLIQNKVKK